MKSCMGNQIKLQDAILGVVSTVVASLMSSGYGEEMKDELKVIAADVEYVSRNTTWMQAPENSHS